MVPDLFEYALALYFSSFMFIFVPALGLATGAVTGRVTPSVGVVVGSVVGLASGIVGLALAFLVGWIAGGHKGWWLDVMAAFVLPLGGAIAPIAILQLVRLWRW